MSVHYIDNITENIKVEFIACEPFEGNHTNDRVAEKLNKIFDNFGILEKVYFITTHSAGNYVAAFKYYGDNYESMERLFNDEDWNWLDSANRSEHPVIESNALNSHIDSDTDDETESIDQVVRVPNSANAVTATDDEIRVVELFTSDAFIDSDAEDENADQNPCRKLLAKMNHINCSSHMLDKVGSIDALKAKQNHDITYNTMYDQVFEKHENIWKCKDSRLSAEGFTRINGRKLIGPHRIRWMKTFDAVSVKQT